MVIRSGKTTTAPGSGSAATGIGRHSRNALTVEAIDPDSGTRHLPPKSTHKPMPTATPAVHDTGSTATSNATPSDARPFGIHSGPLDSRWFPAMTPASNQIRTRHHEPRGIRQTRPKDNTTPTTSKPQPTHVLETDGRNRWQSTPLRSPNRAHGLHGNL